MKLDEKCCLNYSFQNDDTQDLQNIDSFWAQTMNKSSFEHVSFIKEGYRTLQNRILAFTPPKNPKIEFSQWNYRKVKKYKIGSSNISH